MKYNTACTILCQSVNQPIQQTSRLLCNSISASKSNSDCKTQLVTSATQITTHKTPTDSTVPRHETSAFQRGANMLLHITSIMSELQILIYKCIVLYDNISTIISHSNHPANYISPMSRLLASANIQLYKIADIIGCQKTRYCSVYKPKKTH